MAYGTMTSKGQFTVPKEVRDELGLEAGTRIQLIRTADGYLLKPKKRGRLMDLAGSLSDVEPISEADADRRLAAALRDKYLP